VSAGNAEDDIRLRRNLTLNVGVRYEPATVSNEANGKFVNLRSLSSAQYYTGAPLFQNPTLKNFEPSAGVAPDPFGNGKTRTRRECSMCCP
jgi:hypothetical protein